MWAGGWEGGAPWGEVWAGGRKGERMVVCTCAVERRDVASKSWSDRLSMSPKQTARPLMVAGVRALTKVPELFTKYLVEAAIKVDVRYALCVGDDFDDQMLISRCNVS